MTLRNRTLVDTLIQRALGTDASAATATPDEPDTAEPEPAEQPEESD
jgi:hypothetical protein